MKKKAIDETLKRAERLEPKRLVELPVGGAWHSPLLNEAMGEFQTFLKELNWQAANTPVINNVNGEFMPESLDAIKAELVKHLSHPVRWEARHPHSYRLRMQETFTEVELWPVMVTKFGFYRPEVLISKPSRESPGGMCGIAGYILTKRKSDEFPATVIDMLSRIKHRGPDESGYFFDDNAVIGSVRSVSSTCIRAPSHCAIKVVVIGLPAMAKSTTIWI